MKAWVLHDIGDIRYEDIEKPIAGAKEVIIRVKAAGICGSDIPRIYDTGAHYMPLIPGHEFSGEVVEVGDGVDLSWVGKRVGAFPLIPCMKCECCKKQQYEMCSSYSYLGSRTDGGYAEYVKVPAWNLLEIPDNVTYEQAAMFEPMAVAVHAIRRLQPKTEDSVAVIGLGTIGLLLIMFLKETGVENIYAIGNKESQKRALLRLGLPDGNYFDSKSNPDKTAEEWIRNKTSGLGADCVFECVGRSDTINQAINFTAPSAKVMLVGNPHSDIVYDRNTYWRILRRQVTVLGTWNSSYTDSNDDDWHYVLNRLERGVIRPEELITHRMRPEELDKGALIMRDKSEDYIKVMLEDS